MACAHTAIMADPTSSFRAPSAGYPPHSVTRAPSKAHNLEVIDHTDSELQPAAEVVRLDDEISDSFPASDPQSHWAGPRRMESDADSSHEAVRPSGRQYP